MRKNFIFFILFLFIAIGPVFSQETETTDLDTPEIYLNSEVALKDYFSYPKTSMLANVGCTINFDRWKISQLFLLDDNMYDYSSSVLFLPIITKDLNFGFNTITHFEFEKEYYFDIDFLLGLYCSIQTGKHLIITSSFYYLRKSSLIFNISPDNNFLITNTMAVTLAFNVPINDKTTAGFEISSFSKSKYNSFITPFYSIYGNYNVTDNIAIKSSVQISYIDMFTLSANINHLLYSIGLDWRIK